MLGHFRLIHFYDVIQDLLALPHRLLLLLFGEELGHPPCRILSEAEILQEIDLNGTKGDSIHQRKVCYALMVNFLNGGNDSSPKGCHFD